MATKKHAWMHLQEHHLPEMKGMELGKRYTVHAEVEPTQLDTGESEYDEMYLPGGKKGEKRPMTGKFKVHSIKAVVKKSGKGKANGRYQSDEK